MRTLLLASAALLLVALVPAGEAHTTQPAADGTHCITAGNLNEPITTYVKTGLDLIVRESLGAGTCDSGDRGDEVAGAHETLEAVLMAPNGAELKQDLRVQHGAVGRYSFTEPYILTEPGEYFVHVTGTLGGIAVDETILVGSGPVPAWGDHTFPAAGLGDPEDIESRVAALEAMALEHMPSEGETTPGLGVLALLGTVLVAAALVYNREQ